MKINIALCCFLCSLLNSSEVFSQGPGGVSTNLKLWLKADAGTGTAGSWIDQSGNSNSITSMTSVSLKDGSTTNAMNYNPVQSFTATTGKMFSTAGDITLSEVVNTASNNQNSTFIVNRCNVLASYLLVHRVAGGGTWSMAIRPNGNYFLRGKDFYNAAQSVGNVYLSALVGNTSADNSSLFIQNNVISKGNLSGSIQIANPSELVIVGDALPDIPEVIIYPEQKTGAEVQRIQSYLAIKYGLTLDTFANSSRNYVNSAGVAIYNAATYNKEIIGITRDDNSALLQKQSHSKSDSTKIFIGSLATTNALNSGTFASDLSTVVIGNNGGQMYATGSSEFPSGHSIYSRIDREWKITNSNFTETFSLGLTLNNIGSTNLDPANLRILIDDDGDFSNAVIASSPTISVDGNTVYASGISNVDIAAGQTKYITLVSVNSTTPLPIKIENFIVEKVNDNKVSISWKVEKSDELNFEVERLNNFDKSWNTIGAIEGKLNNGQFEFIDEKPIAGHNFYRIKIKNIGGAYEYSRVKSIYLDKYLNLEIAPNPASEFISINNLSNDDKQSDVFIYNNEGKLVFKSIVQSNESQIKIDVRSLPNGVYYLKHYCGHENLSGKFIVEQK